MHSHDLPLDTIGYEIKKPIRGTTSGFNSFIAFVRDHADQIGTKSTPSLAFTTPTVGTYIYSAKSGPYGNMITNPNLNTGEFGSRLATLSVFNARALHTHSTDHTSNEWTLHFDNSTHTGGSFNGLSFSTHTIIALHTGYASSRQEMSLYHTLAKSFLSDFAPMKLRRQISRFPSIFANATVSGIENLYNSHFTIYPTKIYSPERYPYGICQDYIANLSDTTGTRVMLFQPEDGAPDFCAATASPSAFLKNVQITPTGTNGIVWTQATSPQHSQECWLIEEYYNALDSSTGNVYYKNNIQTSTQTGYRSQGNEYFLSYQLSTAGILSTVTKTYTGTGIMRDFTNTTFSRTIRSRKTSTSTLYANSSCTTPIPNFSMARDFIIANGDFQDSSTFWYNVLTLNLFGHSYVRVHSKSVRHVANSRQILPLGGYTYRDTETTSTASQHPYTYESNTCQYCHITPYSSNPTSGGSTTTTGSGGSTTTTGSGGGSTGGTVGSTNTTTTMTTTPTSISDSTATITEGFFSRLFDEWFGVDSSDLSNPVFADVRTSVTAIVSQYDIQIPTTRTVISSATFSNSTYNTIFNVSGGGLNLSPRAEKTFASQSCSSIGTIDVMLFATKSNEQKLSYSMQPICDFFSVGGYLLVISSLLVGVRVVLA